MHEETIRTVHETMYHLGNLCIPCDEIKHYITVGLVISISFLFVCMCTYAVLKRFEYEH